VGRPANADKKTVWSGHPDLVEVPFAMAQDAAGTDNQTVYPRGDGVNVGGPDENAKGVVFLRNAPGPVPARVRCTSHPIQS
jgi:hypothetical protein